LNIKPCIGQISGTWELFLHEYWKRIWLLVGKYQLTKTDRVTKTSPFGGNIGWFQWNQGEKVVHFAWFGEPWILLFLNSNNTNTSAGQNIYKMYIFYLFVMFIVDYLCKSALIWKVSFKMILKIPCISYKS
jgi:hypothetical protein